MFFKEVNNNKIKYHLTNIGKSLIKSVLSVLVMASLVAILSYSSVVEAKTQTGSGFTMSHEEILELKKNAESYDFNIMNADDFLLNDEIAADFEDVTSFRHKFQKDNAEDEVAESEETESEKTEAEDTEVIESSDKKTDVNEAAESKSDKTEIDETEDVNSDSKEADSEVTDIEKDAKEDEVLADNEDWRLILVNKQNPVPEGYDANLSSINGSLLADERIIDDIYDMLDAANKDGVDLMICSAYRSYDRQIQLFNNKMNKLMRQGMSFMDAYAVGSMSVTVPGTSEHQLGLALDILTPSYTAMDDGFGDTKAGQWLRDNAPDYGFILRYPAGKEEITGIIYEPWHFRYVGTEYSRSITESGLCLEEYLSGE